jgi:RNA 2',3'-cyclic 3'-phosphodiesterase
MRLFVAIDIETEIRQRVSNFLDGVRGFATDARWVFPESLHITLKFVGEKSEQETEPVKRALGTIRPHTFDLKVRGYGFFPTARAPKVFWIGIEAGPELGSLAAAVDEALATIGIPKEEHAYNAHLTLARAGNDRRVRKHKGVNRPASFRLLQEKLAALPSPEFGTMTAREFFLYQSRLSPGGSKYTKLARFVLQERIETTA